MEDLPKAIWNIKTNVVGNTEVVLKKEKFQEDKIVIAKSDRTAIIFKENDKYKLEYFNNCAFSEAITFYLKERDFLVYSDS